MRMVLQRVERASVRIAVTGEEVGRINKGIVCLLGVSKRDHKVDLDYSIKKCLNTRLWDDPSGKPWQKSVTDMDYEVLVVSNFTVQAQTRKGNQPDFSRAMAPDNAKSMYEAFVSNLRSAYKPEKIQTGQFQTKMRVEIINDGPVTLLVDTQEMQLNRGPSEVSPSSLAETGNSETARTNGCKAKA